MTQLLASGIHLDAQGQICVQHALSQKLRWAWAIQVQTSRSPKHPKRAGLSGRELPSSQVLRGKCEVLSPRRFMSRPQSGSESVAGRESLLMAKKLQWKQRVFRGPQQRANCLCWRAQCWGNTSNAQPTVSKSTCAVQRLQRPRILQQGVRLPFCCRTLQGCSLDSTALWRALLWKSNHKDAKRTRGKTGMMQGMTSSNALSTVYISLGLLILAQKCSLQNLNSLQEPEVTASMLDREHRKHDLQDQSHVTNPNRSGSPIFLHGSRKAIP